MAAAKAKQMSKADVIKELSDATELPRKKVAELLDLLTEKIIKREVGKKNGVFVLPGLVKLFQKKMPATKQQVRPKPGKPDETMIIPAKPVRYVVKARVLKALRVITAK